MVTETNGIDPEDKIKYGYPFELPLRRLGYYYMSDESFNEYTNWGDSYFFNLLDRGDIKYSSVHWPLLGDFVKIEMIQK